MKYKWGNFVGETYRPIVNRKRQTALALAFIPFFVTVGTNWMYFVGLKLLFKFKPLFLYQ